MSYTPYVENPEPPPAYIPKRIEGLPTTGLMGTLLRRNETRSECYASVVRVDTPRHGTRWTRRWRRDEE
jgi:hypothetical protein